ncbi:unnamed protein product [Prunus brigantina]
MNISSHCFSVQQCSLWKTCLTKVNTNPQSGSNLHDVDMYAKTIFLNDNKLPNRPFKLYHTSEILKGCPKWNDINKPPTQRSSGASASMVNLDNDADEISPCLVQGLGGRDKQKAAKKKKKRKMANPSKQTRDKYLESLIKQGIAFEEDRRRKLNILDKFVQDQAYAYAYHKQQDKEAQEQKLMSMDMSKFTPRKKKY